MPDMELWPTGRLLSTAARLVEHAWNEQLASIGVTHAGVIALEVLAGHGTMTQAQLAQIVHVQAQTMGKTLSRLETYGHIGRVRSTQDRRSHQVTITDHGRSVLASAQELEKSLVPGGQLSSDDLRNKLQSVIKSLADARWDLSDKGVEEAVKHAAPTAGTPPELDESAKQKLAEELPSAETVEPAGQDDVPFGGKRNGTDGRGSV
ncbi:MarR family winged helix-turn-helix transcriptional regulator [Arthrobacter pigmenti]